MAQIIPPITSLPIDSIAAPSAEDIQDRLPSICVDYLSHDWSEEDVWASWRSMTRHKHEIANGVRLENASWRTWQKQRNKLKTISPETLNWLKDSDVTWLYGPLHTAHVEPVRPLKISTADERLGIDLPKGYKPGSPTVATNNNQMKDGSQMKPILKHRTLSEMLTIPMPSSPILESSNFGNDKDVDEMGSPGNRPMLLQTKSDTNIFGGRTTSVRERNPPKFPPETGASGTKTFVPPESAMEGEPAPPPSGKKHISFNTFVEQCVAIDEAPISRMSDSDDDMLEMRSSASSSSRSSRPSISRHSSSASSEHLTIAKIAPTMLKTNGVQIANLPQMVYMPPPEYQSPQLDQSQAVSFDFPSPQVQTRNKWGSSLSDDDDDEYGSVGYDYFGGPDLGGGGQQSVPAHVGTSYGRQQSPSVNVNQAPAQAKWRQQPQQRQQPPVQQQTQPIPQPPSSQSTSTQSSEPSSVGSSSGSLNNIMSPPVPSRGILKVRPPGTTPPEPSSPPTSYFNYNPSAATGIGGMRGQYDYAAPPPVSGSPLVSPATAETRGRSSSRGPGSSAAFDRSSSRGTSVGSSHSLSPGASNAPIVRSPVEAQKRTGAQVTSPGNAVPTVKPAQTTPQTGSTAKQQSLLKDPPPQVIQEQQAEASDPADSMDVDEDEPYQVDRSGTPTPHSSPQIAFRPMKDTSPASLPHTSTRNAPVGQTNPYFPPTPSDSGAYSPSHSPELPKADPPTTRGKATTAHVGTTAQPTLSQPPLADDDDEGDGSSIMGRAANIANTAKDLLGAFWYGHEGGARNSLERTVSGGSSPGAGGGGVTGQGAPGAVGSAQRQVWGMVQKQQGHKRGASMG